MFLEVNLIILILAFLLDLLFGDPYSIPHPVRFYGLVIKKLENFFRERDRKNIKTSLKLYGFYILILSVFIMVFIYSIPLVLLAYFKLNMAYVIFSVIVVYQLIACKSLRDESMKVYKSLQEGNVEKAREDVSMIVGRDTKNLSVEGIIKATIETIAENFSDGVVAPLFYYTIFFVPGIVVYKVVNTLDSMIGYKDDKYKDIGYFSAKFDDVLNFIPSRLGALMLLISSLFFPNASTKEGIRIFIRDRFKHASPNSAQTEAVVAGLFGIKLAGPAYYFGKLYEKEFIGDEIRKVNIEDIKKVNNLMYISSILLVILSILATKLIIFVANNISIIFK